MEENVTKKRKILVFEDDPAFRSSFVSALEGRGFAVRIIENPDKMNLDEIRSYAPDIISLDINMPGKNGFEVFQELKNGGLLASTPVVFVTSQGIDQKENALAMGAKGYFIKFEMPIINIVQQIDNLV